MNHVFASFCTFCTITVKMPSHVSACEYFLPSFACQISGDAVHYIIGYGGFSLLLLGCLQTVEDPNPDPHGSSLIVDRLDPDPDP